MIRETLELDDRDAQEREWEDTTGRRLRWLDEAGWWEWTGQQWRHYGWLVHLNGPFVAVEVYDEIGPDAHSDDDELSRFGFE